MVQCNRLWATKKHTFDARSNPSKSLRVCSVLFIRSVVMLSGAARSVLMAGQEEWRQRLPM